MHTYTVTHTTDYFYGESVPLCHNVVRLRPRDTAAQRCLTDEMIITPAPGARRDGLDFFGNHVSWFSLQEPHAGLSITSTCSVTVTPSVAPVEVFSWEHVRDQLRNTRDRDTIDAGQFDAGQFDARQFTFDSHHAPASDAARAYAHPSFTPGRPMMQSVDDLMRRIHNDFKFVPGSTMVGTSVEDILRYRQGVCQDFAHLMLACLRSVGLAGRYVSGYLVTKPLPGRPKLLGADASHAWVGVWWPGFGWVDFDPTNAVLPSTEHVTVGWARDYDDVAPVKGVIIGGHQHGLRVAVDVTPV